MNISQIEKMIRDTSAQITHQKLGTLETGTERKSKWHAQGGFDALCWLVVNNEELFGSELIQKVREEYGYTL